MPRPANNPNPRSPVTSAASFSAAIFIALALLGSCPSAGSAQQPATPSSPSAIELPPDALASLDTACSELAAEIQKHHIASVAVFGASWDQQDFTELGAAIGDAVSSHLASKAAGFSVLDRAQLASMLQDDRISNLMADSTNNSQWLANELKLPALIQVTLTDQSPVSLTLNLALQESNPKRQKPIRTWKFEMNLSHPLLESLYRTLLTGDAAPKGSSQQQESPAEPPAAQAPQCLVCPHPAYTQAARTAKWHGSFSFSVLVNADGTTSDILLLEPAPYDIGGVAIDTIKKWKFSPALDRNNSPIPQHVKLGLSFQFF
jgi:hypothetical protein